ncbi:MAG TPA: conjugal transfer pilin TrbC [Rhizobium sp.]
MSRRTNILLTCAALVAVSVSLAEPTLASSGGGGLPWESPLQQIQQSITGPVAGFIALAAVAIAGAMLIFGGELNDFARRLCYVALVGGVLLGATQIVALFGATGASIGEGHAQAEQGSPEQKTTPAIAGEGAHG